MTNGEAMAWVARWMGRRTNSAGAGHRGFKTISLKAAGIIKI